MKYKQYQKMKDSGVEWIGEIPEHWEVIGLTKCCDIISGTGFPVQYQGNINYEFPFYKVDDTNLLNNTVYMNDCNNTIKKEDIKILKAKIAPKNCIVFPKIGAALLKNKRRILTKPSIFDNNMMALVPKRHNEKFLYYFLLVVDFAMITNPGPVPSLGNSNIRLVKAPLPPILEEDKIIEFLDKQTTQFDELIAKSKAQITLLEEKRQALINHAVTEGLDPNVPMKDSGVEWIGEIPEHWEVKRLKYLGTAIIGLTYDPTEVVAEQNQGILVLRASNIQNSALSMLDSVHVDKKIPEKLVTKKGDILICSRSGSKNLIGKNLMITEELSGCTFGAFMTVFRSPHSKYISKVLNSPIFLNQTGLFTTVTINQLTTGILNNFVIPFPTDEVEREKIVNYIDKEIKPLDNLISKSKQQINFLQEKRQALITSAVTGKIDVRNGVAA